MAREQVTFFGRSGSAYIFGYLHAHGNPPGNSWSLRVPQENVLPKRRMGTDLLWSNSGSKRTLRLAPCNALH